MRAEIQGLDPAGETEAQTRKPPLQGQQQLGLEPRTPDAQDNPQSPALHQFCLPLSSLGPWRQSRHGVGCSFTVFHRRGNRFREGKRPTKASSQISMSWAGSPPRTMEQR